MNEVARDAECFKLILGVGSTMRRSAVLLQIDIVQLLL